MHANIFFLALLALLILGSFAVVPAEGSASPSGKLASALQPFVERHALAGAVLLVADKDQTLALETVGFANIAARKPMQTDSLFWIASQSKPITGTALMMLVDEGKIGVEDSVETYLPEFKNLWVVAEQDDTQMRLKRPDSRITIRHILSHTSGMPFASAIEQPTLDGLTLRVAALSYAMTPLQSEPGSRYQYSNAGINTAGRIMEMVSGMSYEAFLQERLFTPLGMKDTTFWPNKEQITRLATSYKPNADKTDMEEMPIAQLTYPLDDPGRQPMPAGGLFSTAQDIERFCRMILNGGVFEGKRVLSEEAIREMTRKQTGEAVPESYGLGWATDGSSFGHGGAHSTNMTIDSQRERIYVFLVQHAGFPGDGDQSHTTFRQAAESI
jgi:CubicO group peptidase (beta-lactamase class C family)